MEPLNNHLAGDEREDQHWASLLTWQNLDVHEVDPNHFRQVKTMVSNHREVSQHSNDTILVLGGQGVKIMETKILPRGIITYLPPKANPLPKWLQTKKRGGTKNGSSILGEEGKQN